MSEGGARVPDVEALAAGILAGDRAQLARGITLVESTLAAHEDAAARLLERVMSASGRSTRVGVTGVPGVGKSCFCEALGCRLTAVGHRVAVLAVDPSSPLSGGSILGDKTRMPRLSADPSAFVRPSPASGSPGGVARATREAILLVEAAGYDTVLVETVGVGQSEAAVRGMVDFFLLLVLPGAGDELQGIKRGVMEMADALAVTKADGENLARAELTRTEYASALQYLAPVLEGWSAPVLTCSSVTGAGLDELWQTVERHRSHGERSGERERIRRVQALVWMRALLSEGLEAVLRAHPGVAALIPEVETEVEAGRLPPRVAARRILQAFASS